MLYAITYGETVLIERGVLISAICLILAVIIAFYVLRSIGLYKMAENSGVKNAWFAFIPFGWIFTAGKIIGTAKIFGRPFKNFADSLPRRPGRLIKYILVSTIPRATLATGFSTE